MKFKKIHICFEQITYGLLNYLPIDNQLTNLFLDQNMKMYLDEMNIKNQQKDPETS